MKIQVQDGTILKDGNEIGTIEDGIATVTVKLSNQDKGAIRKAAGDDGITFKVTDAKGSDENEDEGGDEGEDAQEEDAKKSAKPPYKPDTYPVPVGQDPRKGTKTPGWKPSTKGAAK